MDHATALLIAQLEWELAAAQAREAEWRGRWLRMRQGAEVANPGSHHPHPVRPGSAAERYHARDRISVKARAYARLDELLEAPRDDRCLRHRLASARFEAGQPHP